jgi:hypothetical protein
MPAGDGILRTCCAACVFGVLACAVACMPAYPPTPTGNTTSGIEEGENGSMPDQVQVELDIFSGMPNPSWILTNEEANSFAAQLATLPRTSAAELAGNLGYRGFIVQVTREINPRLIRIQRGTVHISEGASTVYAHDEERKLERWLLYTGKPYLKDDLFQIAEREIQ